jgi:hypothetical protein
MIDERKSKNSSRYHIKPTAMRTLPHNTPVWITVVLVLVSGICLQASPDSAVYDTTQNWIGHFLQRSETDNASLSLQYEVARQSAARPPPGRSTQN